VDQFEREFAKMSVFKGAQLLPMDTTIVAHSDTHSDLDSVKEVLKIQHG
jgi:hypothetical protein